MIKMWVGVVCDGCGKPASAVRGCSFTTQGLRNKAVLRQLRPGHVPRWFHHAGCARSYLDSSDAKGLDLRTRVEIEVLADTTTHEPFGPPQVIRVDLSECTTTFGVTAQTA